MVGYAGPHDTNWPPTQNVQPRHKTLLKRGALVTASLLCSALFLGMGASMLASEDPPPALWWFGAVTLAYAGASVVLVIAALMRRRAGFEKLARHLALAYLLLFAVASLDAGGLSGLEVLGVVVVAAALAVNWLVVRMLTRRPDSATG